MKTDEVIAEFRKIKQEYSYNPDIMNEEDERVTRIKKIIDTKLSIADKTIILLYVDCQSYRKLGVRLGVSHMTIRREVQRIKNIIMKEYIRTIEERAELNLQYERNFCGNNLSDNMVKRAYLIGATEQKAIDEKRIKLLEEDRNAFIAFCHNIINGMYISVVDAAQEQLEFLEGKAMEEEI